MNQTNGIVTPSGTIISNAEVDRTLGLGKRMKEEVTVAEDKEAEHLVTTPNPNCKRRFVTPGPATMRRGGQQAPACIVRTGRCF
jgi:hypothetical protein